MSDSHNPQPTQNSYAYSDYSTPDPPHQPLYLHKMLKLLKKETGIKNILDAGCGDGNFTQSIAQAGYKMYGIDLSDGGIARAQKKYPDCTFTVASVYDDYRVIFPQVKLFDAIISVEVIEHLYLPRQFVMRAEEALLPGGIVIVTTPYWGYAKNVVLSLTNRIDRALTVLWDGGHIKHFSYKTLRIIFEERGFEFVDFAGCGRKVPYLWKGMLMAFRKKK